MATLTLKNVPDDLYERLKALAGAHRRSLNQEAIVSLQAAVGLKSPEQLLAEIDAFRERLAARGVWVTADEVDGWIEEGHR